MVSLQWHEEHSLGVPELDAQHQNIVRLVRLVAAFLASESKSLPEGFHETLARLFDCVISHFAAEEALLEAAGYPGLIEHRQDHQSFLEKLALVCFDVMGGILDHQLTCAYFSAWIERHTFKVDSECRTYFAAGLR